MSVRRPYPFSSSISGDMYLYVPTFSKTSPDGVPRGKRDLEMPKSASFTLSSASRRMLAPVKKAQDINHTGGNLSHEKKRFFCQGGSHANPIATLQTFIGSVELASEWRVAV